MIYMAAPLFNDRERDFNLRLASKVEELVPVFLPQRDGTLLVDMLSSGVPQPVAERRVYVQDCEAMSAASGLVAILDGGYIDEGVAFEIGFMAALGRPCVGLQTDVRRALPSGNNPMIVGGLSLIVTSEEELIGWVTDNYERLMAATSVEKLAG